MKVIVIGGGVIGLSTAYFLERDGHDVTLIEQQSEIAQGASHANGGQLSYSYVAPFANPSILPDIPGWLFNRRSPVQIHPQLDPHQWNWSLAFLRACSSEQSRITTQRLLRLSLYSRDLVRAAVRTELLDFGYRQNGKLVLYSSQESMQAAIRQLDYQRAFGCEQETHDADGCCRIEPAIRHMRDRIVGGILTRSDDAGDCYRFCLALMRALSGRSRFHLRTGITVSGFRAANGKLVGLETSDGLANADAYVLAAGIGSRSLARTIDIDLPIYPLKGYSLTVPIADGDAAPRLSITDSRHKIVYTRLGESLRIAGGAELAGEDRSLSERRIEYLVEASRQAFPGASDYSRFQPWCGLRPATPKGTPILGVTRYENLVLNVGHGGLGFTLAMGSGRVTADLVADKMPAISLDGMEMAPGQRGTAVREVVPDRVA